VFTQALVESLSHHENFRLKLNSPVEQIIQPAINAGANAGPYPVQVVVNDNHTGSVTVNAQYVIVATSPLAAAPANLGGTINYTPALEPGAAQLFSSMEATPTVSRQILVVYKNRWWKKQGGGAYLSFLALLDRATLLTLCRVDGCRHVHHAPLRDPRQ
jgi:hypothetical protein